MDWFQRQPAERQNGNAVENEALDAAVRGHLREAVSAATRGRGWSPSRNGAIRERVVGHLDAAETHVLRRAPLDYLRGQLSHVLAHVQLHLPGNDPRRQQVEELVRRDEPRHIDASAREAIVHAVSVASEESRREFARVRNFCQALYSAAIILTVTAVAVAAWGFRFPEHLSMCFSPGVDLVCPTGSAQSPYDVALVMFAGLLAAAVSGSVSLRHITGTSTGIMLPIALAILKLPTGALTALLGMVLLRGGFIPGLSDLDFSAQIVAWAVIFGAAQQIVTGSIDRQASSVLGQMADWTNHSSGQMADKSTKVA